MLSLAVTLWACGQAAEEPRLQAQGGPAVPVEPMTTEVVPSGDEEEAVAPSPIPADVARILALDAGSSTSEGNPNYGELSGAVGMPDQGPGFIFNPRRPSGARFGTVELVQALLGSASRVAEQHPGAVLWVNDLSLVNGGAIPQHQSHQNGRDVDVLFFFREVETGEIYPPVGAIVDPEGLGVDFRDLADPADDVHLRLDVARSWSFVEAFLEQPEVQVSRIFLAEHIRALLLTEAARVQSRAETIELFENVTCQPGSPHDDHFHIRVFCSPDDIAAGCEDTAPLYPWHVEYLAARGQEAVVTRRRRPRVRTTSRPAARRQAGTLHAEVERWLERREEWAGRRPRTGRRFCR